MIFASFIFFHFNFSTALARFSEAILDYIANIEKAPDKQVKKEVFSREIDSAYDILYVWIQSRETKVFLLCCQWLPMMVKVRIVCQM